jgi:putative oxidoreductase
MEATNVARGRYVMPDTQTEPKLLLPQLQSFYDSVIPLAWPIGRIAIGLNLMIHGWGKVSRGPGAFVKPFADLGFEPAILWVWGGLLIEFVGGIALMLGLFTRFWAAAAAIEMAIISYLYLKNGFSWLNRGYEYTLMWGLICFAMSLRGGGPYSLDRKLGREL